MKATRAQIVQVLPLLELSGAERIAEELATRLPKLGFECSVIGLESDQTDFAHALRSKNISVKGLGISRRRTLSCAKELREKVYLSKPTVIHAHMFHATLAARLGFRKVVNSSAAVRVISTCHIVERRVRPWQPKLNALTAKWSAGEVCVSRAVKDFQIQATGLPESFFTVIENGIALEKFTVIKREKSSDAPVVVSVGRLDAQKNYPALLRAWKSIENAHATAVLKIAGQGPEENVLRKLAREFGLRRVEFLGFVNDIPALLASAALYVQSSKWEGFGLAVAEAMAAGLAPVVTNVDSLPLLVRDGVSGRVASNESELGAAILQLLNDADLREKLARAARVEAARRFDVERMVAEYAALYDSVLSAKGK